MKTLRLCIAALALAMSSQASAQLALYGLDAQGNLFLIETDTGAGTAVGLVPFLDGRNPRNRGFNELVCSGSLAWAQQRDGNFQLQRFRLTNGSAIGSPVFNGASWHGMEYIGTTLYAAGFAGLFEEPGSSLATMDPFTGDTAVIGTLDLGEVLPDDIVITGLAWDAANSTLYGITNGFLAGGNIPSVNSELFIINPATADTTPVGDTGMRAGSLSFGPDGLLYAGGVGDNRGELWRINTETGSGTLVGDTGFGVPEGNGLGGLALCEPVEPPQAIPTLGRSTWLLMVLMGLLGMTTLRRAKLRVPEI